MPSTLPDGDPPPIDGVLPAPAGADLADRSLSFYLHVPFCATRCGYCDFNTYTAGELGTAASPDSWLQAALAEIDLAKRVLGQLGDDRKISSVFVGGGTPSLIGAGPLGTLIRALAEQFGFTDQAELTTEANPESADPKFLDGIRAVGFNRLSLGMQSTAPHVLATLDRMHTPGRPAQVVRWARAAGIEHISLDLIYGTPGETNADFRGSLDAALVTGIDHLSAYSLIVEPGTRMARMVASGELPMPDDDVLADRYLIAEKALTAAGFEWYEVSNWSSAAAGPFARCRHNLAYWTGGDWWGIGPGAHSHVGGVRWWNVKHPARYAALLGTGASPAHARELLTDEAKRIEEVMLRLRLSDGLPLAQLDDAGQRRASREADDKLLDGAALAQGTARLTLRGRLLADGVALRLLG